MVVVAMHDGRVLNGLIKAQTARTLTLQTQTEAIALDRSEIEGVRPSSSSLMPDGLLDPLQPDEVRDLVALPVASHAGAAAVGNGAGVPAAALTAPSGPAFNDFGAQPACSTHDASLEYCGPRNSEI